LDRATRYAPHLGADDNASGTAAVMELARRFAANPTRRSILVVNFGAEELGEWGSIFFVQYPPGPLDSVVAMVNFDMVGHLLAKRLEVFGVSTSPQWAGLLKGAATEQGMKLDLHDETVPRGYGSDHEAFAEAGIPVAHFYTGTHPAYHTAEDRPGIIDIDGMVRVVGLAESIIRTIGDSSAVLTPATRPHGKR
jgi:Zn-dependent M28 family amino/carboxypeptidase